MCLPSLSPTWPEVACSDGHKIYLACPRCSDKMKTCNTWVVYFFSVKCVSSVVFGKWWWHLSPQGVGILPVLLHSVGILSQVSSLSNVSSSSISTVFLHCVVLPRLQCVVILHLHCVGILPPSLHCVGIVVSSLWDRPLSPAESRNSPLISSSAAATLIIFPLETQITIVVIKRDPRRQISFKRPVNDYWRRKKHSWKRIYKNQKYDKAKYFKWRFFIDCERFWGKNILFLLLSPDHKKLWKIFVTRDRDLF